MSRGNVSQLELSSSNWVLCDSGNLLRMRIGATRSLVLEKWRKQIPSRAYKTENQFSQFFWSAICRPVATLAPAFLFISLIRNISFDFNFVRWRNDAEAFSANTRKSQRNKRKKHLGTQIDSIGRNCCSHIVINGWTDQLSEAETKTKLKNASSQRCTHSYYMNGMN